MIGFKKKKKKKKLSTVSGQREPLASLPYPAKQSKKVWRNQVLNEEPGPGLVIGRFYEKHIDVYTNIIC